MATPAERREIIRQLVPTARRWIVDSVESDAAGSSDAAEWADYLWVKLVEPLAVSIGRTESKNERTVGTPAAAAEPGKSPGGHPSL